MRKSLNLISEHPLVILITAGSLVFFNGLFGNFVSDDVSQLVENPIVQSMRNIGNFFTSSTFYNGGNLEGTFYKPLQSTIFSVIYSFFGANPFFFHLFQLIVHIASAYLLYLVLKHFFRNIPALILALIFLVHPINSQAVFYISATQDILFFFFGILALYITTTFKSKKNLILVALFLFLSLLSKETGIAFSIITACYVLLYDRKRFNSLFLCIMMVFAFYLLLRINAVGLLTKSSAAPITKADFMSRLMTMPFILFTYLRIFIFPLFLSSSYQWIITTISFSKFILPLLVDILFIVVSTCYLIFLRRRKSEGFKSFLFFFIWFWIGIFIHIQIIPLDVSLAERWFYFPIVGLLGMVGIFLESVHLKIENKWLIVVAVVLLVVLSTRTIMRSFDWKDNFTLATHDVKVSPDSYELENSISYELINRGKFDQALVHEERSIQLFPYYTNYLNLGAIYFNLGDYERAKEAYFRSISFGDYYQTYEGLGGLTLVSGDVKDNIVFLNKALKKFPRDAKLWLFLAIVQYRNGEVDVAKNSINTAYKYDQGNAFVYKKIMNNEPLDLKIQGAHLEIN